MGICDTLILDPPLACPRCGSTHDSIQTKLLDSSMSTYRPGMLVPGCTVHSGILKESGWCCPKSEGSEDRALDVWIVIWHGIYAGYDLDPASARRRLDGLDRLDLLAWLDAMQKTADEWRNRYHALRADLRAWLECRDLPKASLEPGSSKDPFGAISRGRIPEEVRTDPDPLRRILERNAPDQPVDAGLFGW